MANENIGLVLINFVAIVGGVCVCVCMCRCLLRDGGGGGGRRGRLGVEGAFSARVHGVCVCVCVCARARARMCLVCVCECDKKAVAADESLDDGRRSQARDGSTDESLDDLLRQLTDAAGELGLNVGRSEGKTKYGAQKIILGRPRMAASGIAMFVNYPGGLEALQKKAGEGLEAVRKELLESGSKSAIEVMNYILNEEAGSCKKKYQNGWMCDCEDGVVLVDAPLTLEGGIVVDKGVKGEVLEIVKDGDTWPGPPSWGGARINFGGTIGVQWVSKDQFQNLAGVVLPSRQIADPAAPGGKRGMLFKDFCEHEVAKGCDLTPAMVFALRFYTTWGFVDINSPLRDPDLFDKKTSHKLAATVYLLDTAIRQSRAVAADSPEANVPLSLFRGIKEREMPAEFKKAGGTEYAPMSTVRKFCIILLGT